MHIENYEQVQSLKALHAQFGRYVGINGIGIVIWLFNGGGYFWPIWVITLWGADLLYQANKLGLLKGGKDKYKEKLLEISKKWEEEHLKKMSQSEQSSDKADEDKANEPKKDEYKKDAHKSELNHDT